MQISPLKSSVHRKGATPISTATPEQEPQPRTPAEPARLLHRGYAFIFDTFLLLIAVTLITAATPLNIVEDSFIYVFLLGVYRSLMEFFSGNTFGKALLRLRVCYFDRRGRERRSLSRLFRVMLRNGWLLVSGFALFLEPDSNLRSIVVILAGILALISYRINLIRPHLGALVLQLRTPDPWEELEN